MCTSRRFGALCMWFFFFKDTATTEIYTLSLHDALPIFPMLMHEHVGRIELSVHERHREDRKSTRLNSSHANISYAVFCLKKKTTNTCPSGGETMPRHPTVRLKRAG